MLRGLSLTSKIVGIEVMYAAISVHVDVGIIERVTGADGTEEPHQHEWNFSTLLEIGPRVVPALPLGIAGRTDFFLLSSSSDPVTFLPERVVLRF